MIQVNTGGPTMTDADIEAMVADRAAGTPDLGGWAWFGSRDSLYLATRRGGRRFVMDFVRKGMRSAQPRFQIRDCMHNAIDDLTTYVVGDGTARGQNQAVADSSVYRLDVAGVDHPDARRLARVPAMEQTILALRAEVAARPDPIGAAWMREQAAIACSVVAAESKEYKLAEMSLGASACCEAIRAIPLPTDADLLAEAMKLPEVAALVDAARKTIIADGLREKFHQMPNAHNRVGDPKSQKSKARDAWLKAFRRATRSATAALAPFTAVKETP